MEKKGDGAVEMLMPDAQHEKIKYPEQQKQLCLLAVFEFIPLFQAGF